MSFMIVDAIINEIIISDFKYSTHAELWIEIYGKNYPNAELQIERS